MSYEPKTSRTAESWFEWASDCSECFDSEDSPLCDREHGVAAIRSAQAQARRQAIEECAEYMKIYGARIFSDGDLSLRQSGALLQAFADRMSIALLRDGGEK